MRRLAGRIVRAVAGSVGRALSPLVPKDPRVVVLAGTDYRRYNENARYLFEYLSQKPDFDVYWFTRDREIQAYLSSRGLKSLCGFFEKYRVLLRAGMVIGCGSVYPDHFSAVGGKTVKYCLMHGIGPKVTIYFGDDMAASLDEIRRVSGFDYNNFTSEHTATVVGKVAYKFPPRKIVVNGYPRVDRLLRADEMSDLLRKKPVCRQVIDGFTGDSRVILYTPTWRHKGPARLPIESMPGFDLRRLEDFLLGHNVYMLYTVHLAHVRTLPPVLNARNIHFIDYAKDKFLDINELLPEVDILMNDYSTTSTDYAVLGRPQIFVMPDYDEYVREQAFVEDYRAIMPGEEARTFDELLELIAKALDGRWVHDSDKRQRFLAKYYDLSPGPSCERHYAFIRGLLQASRVDAAEGVM